MFLTSVRKDFRQRSAFTLVELLVVIAIIAVLVGLLIPAVMIAQKSVRNGVVTAEVNGLAASMQSFKTTYSTGFPPDFSSNYNHAAEVNQTLGRIFRYRDAVNDIPTNPANRQPVNFSNLDCSEALVFWLIGFADSKTHPLTGGSLDPDTGLPPTLIKSLSFKTPLFDFVRERLQDNDQDGFPEYYPAYGAVNRDDPTKFAPYVYFVNNSYQNLYTNDVANWQPMFLQNQTANQFGVPAPRPYLTAVAPVRNGNVISKEQFAEQDKFQIIAAGLDGNFGGQAEWNVSQNMNSYPVGPYVDKAHADNITNFAQGTLESKVP